MRILVTGATGAVGRRFVPRLLGWRTPGDEVRVLVRDERRAGPVVGLGALPVAGDLRDDGDLRRAAAGVDAVVNLAAAFRHVPDEEAWAVNRDAALALGRVLAETGGRLVQASTNLVYGAGRGRPHEEDDEPVPGGPMWGAYPQSKAEAERGLLELHRERGLDVRIARLAMVYGDGDDNPRTALGWAAHWPAHQRLQLVHHVDAGRALRSLLHAPGAGGHAYNVADDAPVSAVELCRLHGLELPDGMTGRRGAPAPDPAPDPWHGIVSTERLWSRLGWRPRYPSVWAARDAGAL